MTREFALIFDSALTDLEVSQRTVEIHRARVMEKMKVRSLAQLVRMVMQIQQ